MSTDPAASERGTHPVQIGHLVMGLAFLGLAAIWLVVEYAGVAARELRWLLPLPWIVAGAAGLVALLVGGRRRSTPAPAPATGTVPPPPAYADLFADDSSYDGLTHEPEPRPATEPPQEDPR